MRPRRVRVLVVDHCTEVRIILLNAIHQEADRLNPDGRRGRGLDLHRIAHSIAIRRSADLDCGHHAGRLATSIDPPTLDVDRFFEGAVGVITLRGHAVTSQSEGLSCVQAVETSSPKLPEGPDTVHIEFGRQDRLPWSWF